MEGPTVSLGACRIALTMSVWDVLLLSGVVIPGMDGLAVCPVQLQHGRSLRHVIHHTCIRSSAWSGPDSNSSENRPIAVKDHALGTIDLRPNLSIPDSTSCLWLCQYLRSSIGSVSNTFSAMTYSIPGTPSAMYLSLEAVHQRESLTDQAGFRTRSVVNDTLVHVGREVGAVMVRLDSTVFVMGIDVQPAEVLVDPVNRGKPVSRSASPAPLPEVRGTRSKHTTSGPPRPHRMLLCRTRRGLLEW